MPAIPTGISPFLWFDNNAEEAVDFYLSIFPASRKIAEHRYGPNMPMPAGTIMTIAFELNGLNFTALNGGPAFKFNEAVSFVVSCETQAEIDYYWDRLLADGGHPVQCGWLRDRFGLSWQIVPTILGQLAGNPRAMQAMMKMTKLDIAALQAAAES